MIDNILFGNIHLSVTEQDRHLVFSISAAALCREVRWKTLDGYFEIRSKRGGGAGKC